jgi:hypothetical protein
MADEKPLRNPSDPCDKTKPEQVKRQNQQEPQSETVGDAQTDQPAPHGRMPLFGT